MATGIPTFRVDLAEGMIDVNNTSADRLFAYCIEADRGPINEPTFVASNREALKTFGVDFAPHFYQGSTGLYIIRVGFEGAQPAKVEYKANINGQEKTVLTITSVYSGPSKHAVKIRKALSNEGLNVTIDIDGITSKNYQNLKDIRKVAERINSRFGEYVIATLNSEVNYADFTNNDLIINEETDDGKLVGGTNGYMLNKNGELAGKGFSELTVLTHGDDPEESDPYRGNTYWIDTSAAIGGGKYALFTNSKGTTEAGVYVISGNASNFTIRVETDKESKIQLVLDGTEISNENFPVIYVVSADKVFVTTTNTVNTLSVTGSFTSDGDTKTDAVIFSKDDLVFNGTGTLVINSSAGNGISGKDDIKFTGGTYEITSAKDSIEANDSIAVYDGSFEINSSKDGFHSENDDDDTVGWIYIQGGTFNIRASSDSIQANTFAQIDGGTFNLVSSEGIEATFLSTAATSA